MISLRDVVTGFGNRDPLAEVWRRNLRGGGGGAAEITGVPPLRYIGNGKPLTDYMIYGNTIQNGTPSAEDPVDVVGSGVWDETRQSYKLPLTINGTEYPIHLGQVETTRRIKKLVLTGEEKLVKSTAGGINIFVYVEPKIPNCIDQKSAVSTHYIAKVENRDGVFYFLSSSLGRFAIYADAYSTTDEFKRYLSAQYAAGTPVTIWYVLAEPKTAVVNEPLMKIGNYADTISFAQAGVTIPTVNGANVLDVPTEVKPSEITIKGGISSV